jgi:exoribonuclease-2
MWVRLLTVPIEGKLVRGFEGLDIGDRIPVQLTSVDVQRGFIDLRKTHPSSH